MIKVYHGTNQSSAFNIYKYGIDLSKGLSYLDFGKGFYTTEDKRKAIQRARKKTSDYNKRYKTNEAPYLVTLVIDEQLFSGLAVKEFAFREQEWFDFVINNRLSLSYLENNKIENHNIDNKYDIVYGEIADGSIAALTLDIRQNKANREDIDFTSIIPDNGKSYGSQYSFHTEKSLYCIKDISCAIIEADRYKKEVK